MCDVDYGEAVSIGGEFDKGVRGMTITELVKQAHKNAVDKGFYDNPREFGTVIALFHGELSEALEAHRNCEPLERIAEEFADVFIRIADTCGYMGLDLEAAIVAKMERNRARVYKHGKAY